MMEATRGPVVQSQSSALMIGASPTK
jgi:hypothetical protein